MLDCCWFSVAEDDPTLKQYVLFARGNRHKHCSPIDQQR